MKKIIIILIPILILIVLLITLFLLYIDKKIGFNTLQDLSESSILKTEHLENCDDYIPKKIYMTYKSKSKIPQKVFDNLEKYAKNIPYEIFDDNDIQKFLKIYYNDNIINKFKKLKSAHKADLFRYCLLYIYGGIYLDVKTELIKNVEDIIDFNQKGVFYTVLGSDLYKDIKQIYQGIILTPPRNKIILHLIYDILNTPTFIIKYNYLIFCKQFYRILKNHTENKKLKPGINKISNNYDCYLFKEVLGKVTKGAKDRYGFNSKIYDTVKDEFIIKTRFNDYPWK